MLFDEHGEGLLVAGARTREKVGARIGFVFQDPGTSLNPLLTLERQITESLQTHRDMTRRAATQRATELLEALVVLGWRWL